MAWRYVSELPQWDTANHNALREQCYGILAANCLSALQHYQPAASRGRELLRRYVSKEGDELWHRQNQGSGRGRTRISASRWCVGIQSSSMRHLTLSLESMSGRSQSDPDVDGGPLNVQRHSGAFTFCGSESLHRPPAFF